MADVAPTGATAAATSAAATAAATAAKQEKEREKTGKRKTDEEAGSSEGSALGASVEKRFEEFLQLTNELVRLTQKKHEQERIKVEEANARDEASMAATTVPDEKARLQAQIKARRAAFKEEEAELKDHLETQQRLNRVAGDSRQLKAACASLEGVWNNQKIYHEESAFAFHIVNKAGGVASFLLLGIIVTAQDILQGVPPGEAAQNGLEVANVHAEWLGGLLTSLPTLLAIPGLMGFDWLRKTGKELSESGEHPTLGLAMQGLGWFPFGFLSEGGQWLSASLKADPDRHVNRLKSEVDALKKELGEDKDESDKENAKHKEPEAESTATPARTTAPTPTATPRPRI